MGASSSRLDFDHTKYDDKICHTPEEIIVQKLAASRGLEAQDIIEHQCINLARLLKMIINLNIQP